MRIRSLIIESLVGTKVKGTTRMPGPVSEVLITSFIYVGPRMRSGSSLFCGMEL